LPTDHAGTVRRLRATTPRLTGTHVLRPAARPQIPAVMYRDTGGGGAADDGTELHTAFPVLHPG